MMILDRIRDASLPALMWTCLILAVLNLAICALVLGRRRHVFPWLRNLDPRRWALSTGLTAVFLMMELIPRLAHASGPVVFAMSIAALAPLVAGSATYPRGPRPPADVQHGSTATDATESGRKQPPQAV
jgi:hypothetical protein